MKPIKTTHDLRAAIRQGNYAAGGYPLYFLLYSSDTVCPACARKHYRYESRKVKAYDHDCIIGHDVHWEGEPLECVECGKDIPSAYGEVE